MSACNGWSTARGCYAVDTGVLVDGGRAPYGVNIEAHTM
jgi:hypothetical protein